MTWRRNADDRLRVAERAAAGGDVYALADLYRQRMRSGTLDPAYLWLAARIPFKRGDVHQAAELAMSETIPQASGPSDWKNDHGTFGFAFMDLFFFDLQDESEAGKSIPADRVIFRIRALLWVMDYLLRQRGFSVGGVRAELLYTEANDMIENMSLWPRGSYVMVDPATRNRAPWDRPSYRELCREVSDGVEAATRRTTDPMLAWHFFMKELQRRLLR